MPTVFATLIVAVLIATEIALVCHRREWIPFHYVMTTAGFGLMMVVGFVLKTLSG